MKNIIFRLTFIIICGAIVYGCTKLNEKVLDESSVSGLTEKQIAEGNIAPVYAKLPDIFLHTNYFALQEISTDEAILPYRGGTDWGDNGIYISLHKHVVRKTIGQRSCQSHQGPKSRGRRRTHFRQDKRN